MELKYYICEHCGNIVEKVVDKKVPVVCCGQKMKELVPGEVDAAVEKHVPVYEVRDGKVIVDIGSVAHPMSGEHYIQWVSLQSKQGIQRKQLLPNSQPHVCFSLCEGDEVVSVYAYCNLHGLWKA